MSALLKIENLNVSIAGKPVCRQLDWLVSAGQHWAVMGLNGVGKTTLFNTIAGLSEAEAGNISLLNKAINLYEPQSRAQLLGYLLQSLSYEFPETVWEYGINALHPHVNRWENLSLRHHDSVKQALELTGLSSFHDRLVNTLSGGEKRRLEISGLMVQNPLLWLLDEPVNHLDLHHQLQMMELLVKSADARNGATISILHDPNLVARYCSHVLMLLGNGNYALGETQNLLNEEYLSELFQHPVNAIKHKGKLLFIAE